MKNVFWFSRLNVCGGVESFLYYLVKTYTERDITVYYGQADLSQALRLAQYADVRQWHGERIKCERFFCNYENSIIDSVDADQYFQIIHADYKAQNMAPHTHPKITKYIGVSKHVCETFKEMSGMDTELSYNPLNIDKPKKVLNLISATRLTREKGKNRMTRLAEMLDKNGIPFIWTIYTNDMNAIPNPSIIYRRPRLDIIDFIANADYLVQLSDTEAYCYSVVEALAVGTPVIVTDCPVYHEIGITNGKHGFILPFDMSDIPLNDIYKGLPKFTYEPKGDRWDEMLAEGRRENEEELNAPMKLRIIRDYWDPWMRRVVVRGEHIMTIKERGEILCDLKFAIKE